MALLDTPSPSQQEVHGNVSDGDSGQGQESWFVNTYYSSEQNSVRSSPTQSQHNTGNNNFTRRKEMSGISASNGGGGLGPPPGLPQSSSTAELVALGLIGSDTADETATVGSSDYNSDGGGYDPRSPGLPVSSSSGGVVGIGVGTAGGLSVSTSAGLGPATNGGGGVSKVLGTGSAGGMGLGLKTPSLTNLANMVRSQSVSSFHSETSLFTDPATTTESPAWGSRNHDVVGGVGGNSSAAVMSSSLGSLSGVGGSGSTGNGLGGVDLSVFGGRTGLASSSRRVSDEDHGIPSWATAAAAAVAQRRSVGSSALANGAVPRTAVPPTSGSRRSLVYNHSDTDLVASFGRLGFGSVGGSNGDSSGSGMGVGSLGRASGGLETDNTLRGNGGHPSAPWSPLTSPNSSPMFGASAPLLEDSLHLGPGQSLDQGASSSGGGLGGGISIPQGSAGGGFDHFTSNTDSPVHRMASGHVHMGIRSGIGGSNNGDSASRLPRHASYPSLSRVFMNEESVHDNRGVDVAGNASGSVSGVGGMSRFRGAVVGSYGDSPLRGPLQHHGHSPVQEGGMRHISPTKSQGQTLRGTGSGNAGSSGGSGSDGQSRGIGIHGTRSGSSHAISHSGAASGHGRGQPTQYPQSNSGGVDGVLLNDGRFVPSSMMSSNSSTGGGSSGGYSEGGYGGDHGGQNGPSGAAAASGSVVDVPWGSSQDPVSLYNALVMKQTMAAAAVSGMRFPAMIPVANGMGVSMVDMASLAAAAQAASSGGGGGAGNSHSSHPRGSSYSGGGGGGGYSPHSGMGNGEGHLHGYGRYEGGGSRGGGMTHRGGVGGVGGMDGGMYMHTMHDMRAMGLMGMGMGRGGLSRHSSMYDILEDVGDGNIYQVQFKRSMRNFLLGKSCERDLQPGDYVKVEADRGEDLGMVITSYPMPDMGRPRPATAGHKRGYGQFEKERLIRAATEEEVTMVKDKLRDEERVLDVCRTKVHQRALPMRVIDAEFQYDRHKLTFFFEAEGRIDFRELVRDLFSLYKTRIWMQQIEPEAVSGVVGGVGSGGSPSNTASNGNTVSPCFSQQFQQHNQQGDVGGGRGVSMGGPGGPMSMPVQIPPPSNHQRREMDIGGPMM